MVHLIDKFYKAMDKPTPTVDCHGEHCAWTTLRGIPARASKDSERVVNHPVIPRSSCNRGIPVTSRVSSSPTGSDTLGNRTKTGRVTPVLPRVHVLPVHVQFPGGLERRPPRGQPWQCAGRRKDSHLHKYPAHEPAAGDGPARSMTRGSS